MKPKYQLSEECCELALALINKKSERSKRARSTATKCLVVIAIPLMFASLFVWSWEAFVLVFLASGVGLFFTLNITPDPHFNKLEYTQILNVAAKGYHHCIYCGWKGIYRHTPYQTTTTIADCSKCGRNLWVEH